MLCLSLFDSLKKKKEPLPELETPPAPEGAPETVVPSPQQVPAFSMDSPEQFQQEMPLSTLQDVPVPPDDMRASPEVPQPQMQQPQQKLQIPQQQPSQAPQIQAFQPAQFQIPPQPQQQNIPKPVQVFKQQLPPIQSFSSQLYPQPPSMPQEPLLQQEPQFFYDTHEEFNEEQHEGHHEEQEQYESPSAEIPFDVTQELLSMPKSMQKQEVHTAHIPKKYLTVAMLLDIGTQLINLHDDITLGKDTAFRLGDLNEQEIEKMARWHALHQSMELRMAEIDKILFKA